MEAGEVIRSGFGAMTLTTLPTGIVPEDYERIEAAVMETARGRWFLMEFARRQRSAETATLLEAIARLENRVASLAQESAPPREAEKRREAPAPAADPRLSALSRLDHLPLEDKLALFS
jgi:cell division septum initiation protein DivIVA